MKQILLLLGILLLSQISFAQKGNGHHARWEKYKAEKIAFVSTNLNLTPEEAEKFWPVYNQMDKERSEAQKKRRELELRVRDAEDSLSEEEVTALTREFAGNIKKEGTLAEKYNEKFLNILPPHKVLKLYQVENEFRMYMFKKYRDQRRNEDKKP